MKLEKITKVNSLITLVNIEIVKLNKTLGDIEF